MKEPEAIVTTPDEKSTSFRSTQLLKVREMPTYAELEVKEDVEGSVFLVPKTKVRGLDHDKYKPGELRQEIEPWLTALFQSEHLSLLVGAGLTASIHKQVTDTSPTGFLERTYCTFDREIQREAAVSATQSGRGQPNAEDQLTAALTLREGLRILLAQTSEGDASLVDIRSGYQPLVAEIGAAIEELLSGTLKAEQSIRIDANKTKHEQAILNLISFLMSFASRTGTRDRLHIFTTNYDRVIEFGSELAGLRLIDRFVGLLSPIFRSSRLDVDFHYNPPGMRGEPRYLEGVARFTKLHGSLDWIQDDKEIRRCPLPFGVANHQDFLGDDPNRSLIYPNNAKDRETANYPYVELFRDFAGAICRPNSTLVTYGYSFGDDHINRIILDMLTIPSTHVVIINYSNTGMRLTRFFEKSMRPSQISLIVGDHLGDLSNLVDQYLPKPAIDRSSIKMADLLRARGYSEPHNVSLGKDEAKEDIEK